MEKENYQNKFKEKIGGSQAFNTKICGVLGSSFLRGIKNNDFNQELWKYIECGFIYIIKKKY